MHVDIHILWIYVFYLEGENELFFRNENIYFIKQLSIIPRQQMDRPRHNPLFNESIIVYRRITLSFSKGIKEIFR